MRRVEIRSPQTGLVHQLAVHTVGGVIAPGEQIMLVVPKHESLVLEARIAPQDIDNVVVGQTAVARLSAFNQRATPEISGKVFLVGADATRDQQSGISYFVARIRLDDKELKELTDVKLVPGMPAEVYVQTGNRTALSYMLKPLQDQFARAFKER